MADTHAKEHDYHLVDPSPWPCLARWRHSPWPSARSRGCARTSRARACWHHGALVVRGGAASLIAFAWLWWRDVIREAHKGDHTPVVPLHLRYGMILFIASEVMFFVAWFWAYFDASLLPGGVHELLNNPAKWSA